MFVVLVQEHRLVDGPKWCGRNRRGCYQQCHKERAEEERNSLPEAAPRKAYFWLDNHKVVWLEENLTAMGALSLLMIAVVT